MPSALRCQMRRGIPIFTHWLELFNKTFTTKQAVTANLPMVYLYTNSIALYKLGYGRSLDFIMSSESELIFNRQFGRQKRLFWQAFSAPNSWLINYLLVKKYFFVQYFTENIFITSIYQIKNELVS